MAAPLALFRCDASALIGAGHVMRCLALAEWLREAGWRIAFAVGKETVPTVPALAASGFRVCVLNDEDPEPEALREQASGRADLLVVDHYKRDVAFETSCRSFASKILVLDDATGRNHDCDIVVDAAASNEECYAGQVPAHARVLTGLAYALVRRSFVAHREMSLARRDGRQVQEILVSCGATDPGNATTAALESLDYVAKNISSIVVLSSRAPHVDTVRKQLHGKARLLTDVQDMAELMTNADLAIGASGSTAYERAVVGLPSILVTVADNQRGIARRMTEGEAALDGGALDRGLVTRLRALVNLFYPIRIFAGALRRLPVHWWTVEAHCGLPWQYSVTRVPKKGKQIRLRLAARHDEGTLLKIQQDPQTRRYFRNPACQPRKSITNGCGDIGGSKAVAPDSRSR